MSPQAIGPHTSAGDGMTFATLTPFILGIVVHMAHLENVDDETPLCPRHSSHRVYPLCDAVVRRCSQFVRLQFDRTSCSLHRPVRLAISPSRVVLLLNRSALKNAGKEVVNRHMVPLSTIAIVALQELVACAEFKPRARNDQANTFEQALWWGGTSGTQPALLLLHRRDDAGDTVNARFGTKMQS